MTNDSWQTKKLTDIVSVTNGTWGPADNQGTAVLRSTNFTNEGYLLFDDVAHREVPNSKISELNLCKGDILLEKSGGSPAQPVGRVVFFDKEQDEDIVFGNFISRLRPSGIDSKFLFYFLLHLYKKGGTNRLQNQTTGIRNLIIKKYLDIRVPIPSVTNQQKIVEKLDSIRQLQELNQIEIEKAEELFNSGINSLFNHNGVIKPLGSVCKVVGGGTPSRENKSFYSGKIPWVTIKDLSTIEISDSKEHINDDAISNSAVNLVEENTILVATRVGLGKMGMAKTKLTFNQDIKGLICFKEILPYYLLYFLLSQAKFIERSGQGATVKGINQDLLKKIKIPVPATSIQQEIVNKLNSLFKFKTQLSQTKDLLFELFESTLNKSMKPIKYE